jgi:spore coat polysaccharide biosynthesis protein SpsF
LSKKGVKKTVKTAAIIQARMTSSRLPRKTLMDICGKPALQRVIERTKAAKSLDDVIVATTTNEADNSIIELCDKLNCHYYRGSEDNVLSRVLEAAKAFDIDVLCEITADCPLIDWNHIDSLVNMHLNSDCDMTSNIINRTFPRGYDIRVFNRESLERANNEVDNPIDRQHVSTWMYLNPKGKQNYKVQNWDAPCAQFRPDIEVTLDTPEDLELIRWIYGFESQGYNMALTCQEVISLICTYPGQYEKVKKIQRKNYYDELDKWYADNKKTINIHKKKGRPKVNK